MAPSAVEPETIKQLSNKNIARNIKTAAPSVFNVHNTATRLAELDASKLVFTPNPNPRVVPAPGTPEAALKLPTDHMVTCNWTSTEGWAPPQLCPYGPLALLPTASCLHYATECFEGLKLYRGYDGKLRLFRSSLNARRLLLSATRVTLPAFPPAEVEKLIFALCAQEGPRFLPKSEPGTFLYIRPSVIGTDADLGIKPPNSATLFIMLSIFPRLDEMAANRPLPGLRLFAPLDDAVRAWPGGFGSAKLGANYGPSLVAQAEASRLGYDQVLWLFGPEGKVTEAGTSNFFVVWRTREGRTELVTAPLEEGLILDGITRRSVLELARERLEDGTIISERWFQMRDIIEAAEEGRLVEAFSVGTAYFITAASTIHYRGRDIDIPMSEGTTGVIASRLRSWLADITYGKEQHEWGVVVPEV